MNLRVDRILAEAESEAGLADWGTDNAFVDGLTALVDASIADELPERSAAILNTQLIQLLVTRLRFVGDAKRAPEIERQEIRRPLILTGLPRTGTTILHDLCALDPAARAPQEWESSKPWPAPDRASYTTDPRIAETQREIDARLALMPVLRTMHPWGATLPADCLSFFALSFVTPRFMAVFWLPSYAHWLATSKPPGIYRTHKRALQQLQWRGPKGRWTLKEPQHLLDLEQLLDVYPDACIVQTHRDPVRTLPSNASLIWTIQSMLKPDLDKKSTGKQIFEVFGAHLERAMAARHSALVDKHVLDITYRDTVLDPVGTVRRIYDHFGFAFSPEHADRIERHIAENPQDKFGTHFYSADEFGLGTATVRDFLPDYRDRFGDLLSEPMR